MECTVTWTGASGARSGMGFVAETGSGHVVAMDGAPDANNPANGGQNLAARPMELLLAGTGGCTAYDVVLILKRGRHDVKNCTVALKAERAETAKRKAPDEKKYGDRPEPPPDDVKPAMRFPLADTADPNDFERPRMAVQWRPKHATSWSPR